MSKVQAVLLIIVALVLAIVTVFLHVDYKPNKSAEPTTEGTTVEIITETTAKIDEDGTKTMVVEIDEITLLSTNLQGENLIYNHNNYDAPSTTKVTNRKVEITENITEIIDIIETTVSDNINTYSDDDLYIMSHLIMGEAGGQSWDTKVGVGSVALNRVNNSQFPNTLYGVVFQRGQYSCTWDGNYNKSPNEESINAAKYVLENGSQLPYYVLYQAMFVQGNVYKVIDGEYFCYYSSDVRGAI